VEEQFEGELATFARMGSGSACRSVYGGFVEWNRGFESISELDLDLEGVKKRSIAKQIFKDDHWEELRLMILVIQSTEKDVPSTKGMKLSKDTSDLIQVSISIYLKV
jgi:diphosphomevalonate decarboxylase